MTAEPRISIAMATYNGALYIREQLDSLAAQKLLPCELVVTDDGSTDDTVDIIRDFAQLAPFPVRIHCNEDTLGSADNFLLTTSLCKGDIIAFCDQDDIWHPDKLARCMGFFNDSSTLLCVHSANLIDASGNLLNRRFPNFGNHKYRANTQDIFGNAPYYGFSMIFRRILVDILPVEKYIGNKLPPYFGHDLLIGFLSSYLGDTIFLEDTLALYRQHQNNVSGGVPQARNIREKINNSVSTSKNYYKKFLIEVIQQEKILTELSNTLSGDFCVNSRCGALRCARLRSALMRVTECYNKTTLFSYVSNLSIAVFNGDYGRRSKGCLGYRSLIKDIIYALSMTTSKRIYK
jgi:glycosyltransferase involved in cell wall biosynthesis